MALGYFIVVPGVDLETNSLDEVGINDSNVASCAGFQVIMPVAAYM